MTLRDSIEFFDPLYGHFSIREEMARLVFLPPVQRLRHVRLSNIDSLTMPGISGLSRYEHVLGAYFLATQSSLARKLSREDRLVLQAAALLHDWAITPSGHLVAEAFAFLGRELDHELKLGQLLDAHDPSEIGGAQRQMLYGRESGLIQWAKEVFATDWERRLNEITTAISGKGKFGPCICGSLDVDNLDNVSRIAFHMGLDFDRQLPLKIAHAIMDCIDGHMVFETNGVALLIDAWLQLRTNVYEHLMTSRLDFSGKLMLIHASMWAYQDGLLKPSDWVMNDLDFFGLLLNGSSKRVKEVVQRWFCGEPWSLTNLVWFESSQPPTFDAVREFSEELSKLLKKDCYAYRIKDKRTRRIQVWTQSGQTIPIGKDSHYWLLGVGTPKKEEFSVAEEGKFVQAAATFFKAVPARKADSASGETSDLFVH